MARKRKIEAKQIRPQDIDPHHDWSRPVPAPGHTQVDFEERVNFRRLHDYRLARVRAALSRSALGALLAWLGVQVKRAEAAGDAEGLRKLRRRIEMIGLD